MTGRASAFAAAAAAVVVIAVSLWLVRDHALDDSLSPDEPVHILSGYLQVTARTSIVNIEHPPLAKVLAGLAVSSLPLPKLPDPPPPALLNDFGHGFVFGAPLPADRIAAAARAPFLGVLGLLLALVFLAARRRYGDGPALFAMALLAFDPNLVAHAGIVHTDLAACVAFLAGVLAWDAAARRPMPARVAVAAVVLGLALATKFSTVYLIPIFAIQGLLAVRREPQPGRAAGHMLLRLGAVTLGGILVVVAIYAPVTARMDVAEQQSVIHAHVAGRGAPGLSKAIEGIAPASRPLAQYLGGLAAVARQNAEGGGINYLLGRVSDGGFPSYFFFAYFAKSSLAFVAVAVLVLWGLVRGRRPGSGARSDAALLLIPVAVLFLVAAGASYNIGIRHLLPVYPFLALAAAGTLVRLLSGDGDGTGDRVGGGGRRRPVALALLVGMPLVCAVEIARVHPNELSYFNAIAGGPIGGRRILSDSNVDWGLDLKRLAAELRRRDIREPTVCYFGGDDVFYRLGVADFNAEPKLRGRFVAISAFEETLGPAFYAYHGAPLVAQNLDNLRRLLATRGRLVARIGYSMDLYELAPGGTQP